MRRVTVCVEQTALYDGCGASVLCSDVRSAGCQPVFIFVFVFVYLAVADNLNELARLAGWRAHRAGGRGVIF